MMRALRRLVCRVLGHRWETVTPKKGEPASLLFANFVVCWRCGKLDR